MMKIKVGNYIIESNGRCYEAYLPKKYGKQDRIKKTKTQYYVTMESMLKCLPERILKVIIQ